MLFLDRIFNAFNWWHGTVTCRGDFIYYVYGKASARQKFCCQGSVPVVG